MPVSNFTNIDPDNAAQLRGIFRSFKRSASRLRDCAHHLEESASLQFKMSYKKDEALYASFNEGPSLVRYAALLRPFMVHTSAIELNLVWNRLLAEAGLVDDSTRQCVSDLFAAAENLGIGVVLNEKPLTSRDLYFAYAEGMLFDENVEAKKLLEQLSIGPMQQMVQFLFYSACMNYSKLVFAVLNVILDIERNHLQLTMPHAAEPRCIYCLTRDGDFGPEEHVIPEAFGVDDLILRDAVCGACNNKLSRLDQFFAEFEPLALLRVVNVPLTKKGKFPIGEFRDFSIKKVKPRNIRFTSKTKKDVFVKEELPDGVVRLSRSMTTRTPLDALTLARSLFKIGLGLVAHDGGAEYACNSRFDVARDFIRGHRTMPNHLLFSRDVKPGPSIITTWQSFDGATAVCLDIFGVKFVFNLEATPLGVHKEMSPDTFMQFWLGTETKGGVVLPCLVGCVHS